MQRINTPDGKFHAGDPSAGVKGSVVTRDFMQTMQEELAAIPESVGIKLDKNDDRQILKAIRLMLNQGVEGVARLSGADFRGPVSSTQRFSVGDFSGGYLGVGNGDQSTSTTNNVELRSWFGIGFGPSIDNMPVPRAEYSHWFNVRTGDAGIRGSLSVAGGITAATPAAGDVSDRAATTRFVATSISTAAIGTITFEARTTPRAGHVRLNGALLRRDDYPALWQFAQSSGLLVSEAEWNDRRWGAFSTGDGVTTFRVPEVRGEFIRCLDDGRGVDPSRLAGTWQDSQNRWHGHGASCSAEGDHVHGAWTDAQGNHQHHGWTGGVGDHQHVVPYTEAGIAPWGVHSLNRPGSHGGVDHDNPWAFTSPAGAHNHEFYTEWAGQHGHNVGIGVAGRHGHAIGVAGDGGNEVRVRSVAFLATMRAF